MSSKTKKRITFSVVVDSDIADQLPSGLNSMELVELLMYSQDKQELGTVVDSNAVDNATIQVSEVNAIIENKFTNILNNMFSKFNIANAFSHNDTIVTDKNASLSGGDDADEDTTDFFASFLENNNNPLPNQSGENEEEEMFVFNLDKFEEG